MTKNLLKSGSMLATFHIFWVISNSENKSIISTILGKYGHSIYTCDIYNIHDFQIKSGME